MKKIILVAVFMLFNLQQFAFSKSPKTNIDELVGSTFECPGTYGNIYTFFPDQKYNHSLKNIQSGVTPISYEYDGKDLSLTYIGVDGKQRTLNYEAMYLKEKRKLIMKDEQGKQQICVEH
jgi:hypothetical protein